MVEPVMPYGKQKSQSFLRGQPHTVILAQLSFSQVITYSFYAECSHRRQKRKQAGFSCDVVGGGRAVFRTVISLPSLQVTSFHLLFSSTMEPNKAALDLHSSQNFIIRTMLWPLKDEHQKVQHKNACVLASTKHFIALLLPHACLSQSVVINTSGLF